MDNIQFWLYAAFGLIYFIVKQMKKKNARNESQDVEEDTFEPQRRPASFDELLKEFTQGKEVEEELEEQYYESPEVDSTDYSQENVGHRQFADEESKKIYEQSIVQSEGYDLKFERDSDFSMKKSLRINREEDEDEGKSVGEEIFESLRDPNEARKAIILSEILTRKY